MATESRKPSMISIGQNRAPNTIKLRNEYRRERMKAAVEGRDADFPTFEEWAKKNYPDKKILNPGSGSK